MNQIPPSSLAGAGATTPEGASSIARVAEASPCAAAAASTELSTLSLPPALPDHELLRRIGHGSYGEVWLARTVLGELRAAKVVHRNTFEDDRPFQREFEGLQKFAPISRSHPSQLAILHVGRNVAEDYFYYVMELADDANPSHPVAADVRRLTSSGARVSPPAATSDGQSASADSERLLVGDGAAAGDSRAPKSEPPCVGDYEARTLKLELKRRAPLPPAECVRLGLALAEALTHLHQHGLVHRDIKPSNIIFVGGVPKLADIGLVTDVDASRSFVGTEGYLPPEGPGTPQADIYGLGKVLYELCTGKDRKDYPALPPDLRERSESEQRELLELNAVLVKACATDPRERYQSAADVLTDLERLGQGVSIRQVRRTERVWREVRRSVKWALAAAIVLSLGILVSRTGRQPGPRAVERRSTNEVANRYFDLGLHAFERLGVADITLAVSNFQKAIEADPGFARAHAELALIYSRPQPGRGNRESYGAARTEGELALRLDPALPLGHIVIGWSKVFHGFRWRDAEKDFLRALELDPDWDRSHHGYAEFLKASGRADQAVEEMREALRCNPQSVRIRQRLPYLLLAARRYEEAIKAAEDAITMEPNSIGSAYFALIEALCARGDYRKAIEAERRMFRTGRTSLEKANRLIEKLQKAFDAEGARGYWRVKLEEAKQADDSPYLLACIYAHLGDREPALDSLKTCLKEQTFELIWMVKVDWQLDPLRSDPAFQDILKALNLD